MNYSNKFVPKSPKFQPKRKWQEKGDSSQEEDSGMSEEDEELAGFENLLRELLEECRKLNTAIQRLLLTQSM